VNAVDHHTVSLPFSSMCMKCGGKVIPHGPALMQDQVHKETVFKCESCGAVKLRFRYNMRTKETMLITEENHDNNLDKGLPTPIIHDSGRSRSARAAHGCP
jgi:DNA-directed RNA polymerase subunit RPC12/RpoP